MIDLLFAAAAITAVDAERAFAADAAYAPRQAAPALSSPVPGE